MNQIFSFSLVSKQWQIFSRQVFQKCFAEFKNHDHSILSKFLDTEDLTVNSSEISKKLTSFTNFKSLTITVPFETEIPNYISNLTHLCYKLDPQPPSKKLPYLLFN